ncbi:hypothetical protein HMPREF1548_01083 [Clostridium sp. KLE 1755]|nr:hypothetical protein HMPREF1548_01083 [Clostridium sp. KLE 1755]
MPSPGGGRETVMDILIWLIAATGIGMLIYYFVILLKGEDR